MATDYPDREGKKRSWNAVRSSREDRLRRVIRLHVEGEPLSLCGARNAYQHQIPSDTGHIEVDLARLDLHRTRVVFVVEPAYKPAWSQHETSSGICAQF